MIFDEAHQLPDIASQYFGQSLSSRQLQDLAKDFTIAYRTELKDTQQLQKCADRLAQSAQDFRLQLGDIEALPHLVPNEDEAISKQFERAFRKRGIDFQAGSSLPRRDPERPGRRRHPGERRDHRGRAPCWWPSAAARSPPDSATKRSASPSTAASSSPTNASPPTSPVSTPWATSCPACSWPTADSSTGSSWLRRSPDSTRSSSTTSTFRRSPTATRRSHPLVSPRPRLRIRRRQDHELRLQPRGQRQDRIIGTSRSVKVVRVNEGPVVGVHMIGARVGELIGEAQARGQLGGLPGGHRAASSRAPDPERGARRGVPCSGGQAAPRHLTPARNRLLN